MASFNSGATSHPPLTGAVLLTGDIQGMYSYTANFHVRKQLQRIVLLQCCPHCILWGSVKIRTRVCHWGNTQAWPSSSSQRGIKAFFGR